MKREDWSETRSRGGRRGARGALNVVAASRSNEAGLTWNREGAKVAKVAKVAKRARRKIGAKSGGRIFVLRVLIEPLAFPMENDKAGEEISLFGVKDPSRWIGKPCTPSMARDKNISMIIRPITLSIAANVILAVWLLALYARSSSGGGAVTTEAVRNQTVRNEVAQPVEMQTDDHGRPARNHSVTGRDEAVGTKDSKMYRTPLVSAGGLLTSGAAEAAGIDSNERAEVQREIDKSWDQYEISTARRTVMNSNLSDADKGISVFDIPALKDRGAGIRSDLSRRLESLVGIDRTKVLMDSLANTEAFGGLGSYDVRIRFLPADPDRGIALETVEYVATDPESGTRAESASMTLDRFKQLYGDAFVFDAEVDGGDE